MRKFIIVLSLSLFATVIFAQSNEGGGGGFGGGFGGDHHYKEKEIVYHDHPKYQYEYKVADHKHKDYHNQHEIRDGHTVKGVYSLLEPDGKTIRIVEYEADKKGGFRAQVKHQIHH